MTIEELRDKYATLQKDYDELKTNSELQATKISELTKANEDLQAYNRKIFNDYVLAKDEPQEKENNKPSLDELITKMRGKENE